MTLRTIMIACTSLALVACTGVLEPRGVGEGGVQPGPGPDPGPDPVPPEGGAAEQFNANVAPLLEAKCAGCHVNIDPKFVASSRDGYYFTAMLGYPDDPQRIGSTADASGIYTYGQTEHGGFTDVWTAEELTTIKAWIDAEAAARGGGGPGPGGPELVEDPNPGDDCGGLPASECLLIKFARCFTSTNWNQFEPYKVANAQSQTGSCSLCHSGVDNGWFADGDSAATFDEWKALPSISSLVVASVEGNGLIRSNRIREKGDEQGTHPPYVLDGPNDAAVNGFVDATLLLFADGNCQEEAGP